MREASSRTGHGAVSQLGSAQARGRAVLVGLIVASSMAAAGCYDGFGVERPAKTYPTTEQSNSSSVTLTPENPTAVADLAVTIDSPQDLVVTTASLHVDMPNVRVSFVDQDGTSPVVVERIGDSFRIGELLNGASSLRRHAVVEVMDPSVLPATVKLTVVASIVGPQAQLERTSVNIVAVWSVSPPQAGSMARKFDSPSSFAHA